MKYLSVCSGIEAATVAWSPLGWTAHGFSEIDKFPSAVLAHHYPDTPNFGDMEGFNDWPRANIDVLVGGTPCQSFSVAGLRQGLADPRGNLALVYLAIADRYRPQWLVWENVPGVLSSNRGRDFGSIIGGMVELGYGFAYRVLDAQYFGVPQRRRRVFVVGHLGDWRRAAEVLFEPQSLRRNPPPSREARQVAPTIPARRSGGGGLGTDFDLDGGMIPETVGALTDGAHNGGGSMGRTPIVDAFSPAMCLNAGAMGRQDAESETLIPTIGAAFDVAHALRGEGFDASEDGTGRGTPLIHTDVMPTMQNGADTPAGHNARSGHTKDSYIVPMAFAQNQRDEVRLMDKAGALAAEPGAKQQTYVFKQGQGAKAGSIGGDENVSPTLGAADSGSNRTPALMHGMAVRRLTPVECERLQGFPDGYTDIPWRQWQESQRTGDSYESILLRDGLRLREPAGNVCPDSPRYKALGNSMAVPVMRWIGERITDGDRRDV